jgi:sulfite reductase (NADPH) flavoprotein alpha-component
LHEALTSKLEIVRVTRRLLRFWADQSGISELGALCEEGQAELRAALLKENHVIDLLRRFPLRDLSAQSLVDNLRPLQPRLYSIASSAAFAPGEVHLTVAVVRYPLHGELRHGVASAFLADAAPETSVPVFVQSNPHFRLPANDVPIVMIGAGTGIAPFRAFLQEREMRGASGKNWLFFGERHFRTDFLYQTEWQAHLHSGLLTRMNVAFSREGTTKTYAQHRLLEQARDLYAWLQDGCHIYVCGDAVGLTPGVHAVLRCVLQQEGGLDLHAAEEHLTSLRSSRRYQIDAY